MGMKWDGWKYREIRRKMVSFTSPLPVEQINDLDVGLHPCQNDVLRPDTQHDWLPKPMMNAPLKNSTTVVT